MSRSKKRRHHGPYRLVNRRSRGVDRWYAEFPAFKDVFKAQRKAADPDAAVPHRINTRVALIPEGASAPTDDRQTAVELAQAKLEELREYRRGLVNGSGGRLKRTTLADAIKDYFRKREQAAERGRLTHQWIDSNRVHLAAAQEFLGTDRDPRSIEVEHVRRYMEALAERPNGRGGTLSEQSILHYLHSLSNLFAHLAADGYVPIGHNPVRALPRGEKPSVSARPEALWYEPHEAAALLESARLYRPDREDMAIDPACVHAVIATMLLTGGRKAEVLGLRVQDVSFDRRTVTFRETAGRRLKTRTSWRAVPLWPQLEGILQPYILSYAGADDALLFPSPRTGRQITDLRKVFGQLKDVLGWEPRTKPMRHTYCSARLQTLDRGAPVSAFTVAREMGHGGDSLVKRVYGHLGSVRQRTDVVEFRTERPAAEPYQLSLLDLVG